ncbi:MAG: hypothetical protein CMJ64_17290 [Planctomycetaceae bacterium]|nr:hypothetical protein [Planctomycetaceae bacterium]
MRDDSAASGDRLFETMLWNLVIRAGEPTTHQQALATRCERYWMPLYAYLRRADVRRSCRISDARTPQRTRSLL